MAATDHDTKTLREARDELTAALIVERVQQFNENRSAAARSLGMSREGMHKIVMRLGIELPPPERPFPWQPPDRAA